METPDLKALMVANTVAITIHNPRLIAVAERLSTQPANLLVGLQKQLPSMPEQVLWLSLCDDKTVYRPSTVAKALRHFRHQPITAADFREVVIGGVPCSRAWNVIERVKMTLDIRAMVLDEIGVYLSIEFCSRLVALYDHRALGVLSSLLSCWEEVAFQLFGRDVSRSEGRTNYSMFNAVFEWFVNSATSNVGRGKPLPVCADDILNPQRQGELDDPE